MARRTSKAVLFVKDGENKRGCVLICGADKVFGKILFYPAREAACLMHGLRGAVRAGMQVADNDTHTPEFRRA